MVEKKEKEKKKTSNNNNNNNRHDVNNEIHNVNNNEIHNVNNDDISTVNNEIHNVNNDDIIPTVNNENLHTVDNSDIRCSICLDSLDDPTQPYELHKLGDVPHSFHATCLNKWIKECIKSGNYRPTCPICRERITLDSAIDIANMSNPGRIATEKIISLSFNVYIFIRLIFPRIPYLTWALDSTVAIVLFKAYVKYYDDVQHLEEMVDISNGGNKDKYGNFLIEILEKIIEYKHGIDTKEIEKAITYIKYHKIEDKL